MKISPQKRRMLKALLAKDCTSRELMGEVGCNNPSDIKKNLRKDNNIWLICPLIPFINRDGKKIMIGLFSIPESERKKAKKLLKGTVIPKSNTVIT